MDAAQGFWTEALWCLALESLIAFLCQKPPWQVALEEWLGSCHWGN